MAKTSIDLHLHPYPEKYGVKPILKAMEKNDVKILGLPYYNEDNFFYVRAGSNHLEGYKKEEGNISIKMKNKETGNEFYFFRAMELMNKGNLHLLVVGRVSDLKPHDSIMYNIETGIKNNALVLIDHAFANAEHAYKPIDSKKKKELEVIAKEFGEEIAWEWNGYCKPCARKFARNLLFPFSSHDYLRTDANQELENFEKEMKEKGCKVNIVADSDIHARTPGALKEIGKAGHIKIDENKIDFSSEEGMLSSMKNEIKRGENIGYENHKGYVSSLHLVRYFILPYIFRRGRSRG